ncbi:polysaccharide biosynthesis C-terminal domain-containing protein [Methylobacterium sp. WL12]|uniref:oligosaccharide flippase family protein n=1 Tax=Methylobacterium sp. WL12 TaxID=2603890 RepID=UPI001FEED04E|nr:polysaccharide biosynthesis C-terminal domain-containing protein [Methylobacterium sp. WL12]
MRYGINLVGQAAGRGIYLLAGFAAFVMVAKVAGPVVLGHYGIALAALAIALMAADFGTTLTFAARIGACEPDARAAALAAMLSARLILGAGTGLALLCALPLLPAPTRPALTLAALAMPLVAARFLDALFQVCGRPGWSAYPSLANAAVLVVGTALALSLDAPEAVLPLVAVAAGTAYGAIALVLAGRLVPLRVAALTDGLATIRGAAGVGVSNALGTLNARIGLLALAAFAGAAEVGLFTAGYRFFELGVAVAITLAAPLLPVFGRAVGAGTLPAQTRLALRLVLSVAGPGVIAAWVLADPLVRLLFGPDYAASVPVLRIAALMAAAMIAATILFSALVALGRTGFAVPFSAAGCAVNAVLCLVLVPRAGATGAALAALAAEFAMLAVVVFAFRRSVGAPLLPRDWPAILVPTLAMATCVLASPAALAPVALPAGALLALAGGLWLRPRDPLAGPSLTSPQFSSPQFSSRQLSSPQLSSPQLSSPEASS